MFLDNFEENSLLGQESDVLTVGGGSESSHLKLPILASKFFEKLFPLPAPRRSVERGVMPRIRLLGRSEL